MSIDSNYYIKRILSKSFIPEVIRRNHSNRPIRLMTFGQNADPRNLLSGCLSTTPNQSLPRNYNCGDFQVAWYPTQVPSEELNIIALGERDWGKPARPSGPLSSFFGREYGRDSYNDKNKPDFVLADSSTSLSPNWADFETISNAQDLEDKVTRKIISKGINNIVRTNNADNARIQNNARDQGYRNGYRQGKLDTEQDCFHQESLISVSASEHFEQGRKEGERNARLRGTQEIQQAFQRGRQEGQRDARFQGNQGTQEAFQRGRQEGKLEGFEDAKRQLKKAGSDTIQMQRQYESCLSSKQQMQQELKKASSDTIEMQRQYENCLSSKQKMQQELKKAKKSQDEVYARGLSDGLNSK